MPAAPQLVADVVVIGLGAAGATAAMVAHDLGAQVLVIDKAPQSLRGGNSRVSGQIVFWPNDVDKAMAYFRAMAGDYMDGVSDAMVRVWAEEMHANRAWLEGLGLDVARVSSVEYPELPGADCVEVLLHGAGPYGQARLWDQVIAPAYDARGITTLFDTAATSLVREGDAIVGVLVERAGERIRIDARRAVVLACGGFQNDQSMVRRFLTDLACCYPLGTPYNTGDGIRMAMAVGADLWHMNNIAGPMLAFKAPEHPVCARLGAAKADSYLYVGRDGTRFIGEAANFKVEGGRQHSPIKHGKVLRNGRYVQYPCPLPIHMVFDETVRRAGGICGAAAGFTFGWDVIHGNLYQWSADNRREIERGWIRRADTIAELAGRVGLDPAVLEATVQRYNAACDAGLDAEWDRNPATLSPLRTPPYYAIELVPASLNTQGGPVRNERAQVVDVFGQPIPRLYSAGELGSIYAYRYQAGGNLGECFAFGRIAGRNAAAQVPRAVSP
jgi:succinate dehydrogenase/fumarate reductase flavoprotein subunit